MTSKTTPKATGKASQKTTRTTERKNTTATAHQAGSSSRASTATQRSSVQAVQGFANSNTAGTSSGNSHQATAAARQSAQQPAQPRQSTSHSQRPQHNAQQQQQLADYLKRVERAIARNKSYPRHLQRRGITGAVTVSFHIAASGQISHARVIASSGHSALDNAAVKAVSGARSSGATPTGTGLTRKITLQFQLR